MLNITNIIDLHKIFYFLGTPEGELVKNTIEFMFFIFITYMVISEYTRNPRREYKYLTAGFGALSGWKFATISILGMTVYGTLNPGVYLNFYPILNHSLEVLALIFLSNAFMFHFSKEKYDLRKRIFYQIIALFCMYAVFQVGFIIEALYFNTAGSYVNYHSHLTFTVVKIILIMYAVYMLLTKKEVKIRYRQSTIAAFLIYMVTPLLHLISLVIFGNIDARILVAEQPFPLFSIIVFTRVMYLKLVDKAYLKKQLEHERTLSKMKDQFVSVVSHELRTPLTSIGLYCNLLEEKKLGNITPKQRDAVKVIKGETKRLNVLVSDILDLSRLEGKRTKLNISEFKLKELCNPGLYKSFAETKRIRIVNKVPARFSIKADKDKITQVLMNLISNAIKYSPDKTKITIEAKKESKRAYITIRDEGYGIPKEERARIFDKFYQIEHHMTRKQGGVGLGLAIVKEIVDLHKGTIKVDSEESKGSTFTISIPQ